MSGYLQRLVSSARKPGVGILPLPRSIYAEARPEPVPAIVDGETLVESPIEDATSGKKEIATRLTERPPSVAMEPPQGQPVEPAFTPLVKTDASRVERHVVEERFHEAEATVAAPGAVELVRIQPVGRVAPRQPGPQPAPAAGVTEVVRQRTPFQPLVSPRPALVPERHQSPSTPAVEAADEIQIHIGRIEVTAVPPPSPRAAAPTKPKSLDLGEYLKRGHGRRM